MPFERDRTEQRCSHCGDLFGADPDAPVLIEARRHHTRHDIAAAMGLTPRQVTAMLRAARARLGVKGPGAGVTAEPRVRAVP